MNYKELQERCKNRNFDQIVIVTDDIFKEIAEFNRVEHVTPGVTGIRTNETNPGLKEGDTELAYTERYATIFYNNTSLCVVQPVEGDTLYKKYQERFGNGICCARERIPVADWDDTLAHYTAKGATIAQTYDSDTCHAVWLDLMDELGIIFEAIRDDSVKDTPSHIHPARIAQINISTPDVRKTIARLTDLFEIGPWEVGDQCNAAAHDYAFTVNGELVPQDFSYLLAILVCGNIEWEVIEPVKGELVYSEFIEDHGIGFHHILQEYHVAEWQDILADYASNGIAMNCKGSIGPVDWCYMDTVKELGYFKEMRTDAVMDQLPDGYFQFWYPEP